MEFLVISKIRTNTDGTLRTSHFQQIFHQGTCVTKSSLRKRKFIKKDFRIALALLQVNYFHRISATDNNTRQYLTVPQDFIFLPPTSTQNASESSLILSEIPPHPIMQSFSVSDIKFPPMVL